MSNPELNIRHVLVRLVNGPIYQDDTEHWIRLLRERDFVDSHFQWLGLELVVDEDAGFAFLRQADADAIEDADEDSEPAGGGGPSGSGGHLPRLMRRTPLGFLPTVLMVELRERLLRHDQAADGSDHLYLDSDALRELLRPYLADAGNEQKLERQAQSAIRRLVELAILRHVPNRRDVIWRVEPILRAKLPIEEMEHVKRRLLAHLAENAATEPNEQADESSETAEPEIQA